MILDFTQLRESLTSLRKRAADFFETNEHIVDRVPSFMPTDDPNGYWDLLDAAEQDKAHVLQRDLLSAVGQLGNSLRLSGLASEADRRDLGRWTKSLRASLGLREYDAWDTEVLHDEGIVLGVRPAGQSESTPLRPARARRAFDRDMSKLLGLLDLLEVSSTLPELASQVNPQVTTEYKPGTAFVMMQINADQPSLEDVYETIKDCFAAFGIKAIRADEIEHEDVITARILKEIETSEFLIADLTGERPSVYYEVGYAHCLGRRVMLYRQQGTRIHFDLAAYNCPEYKNITELRKVLLKRLESVTGKKSGRSQIS